MHGPTAFEKIFCLSEIILWALYQNVQLKKSRNLTSCFDNEDQRSNDEDNESQGVHCGYKVKES